MLFMALRVALVPKWRTNIIICSCIGPTRSKHNLVYHPFDLTCLIVSECRVCHSTKQECRRCSFIYKPPDGAYPWFPAALLPLTCATAEPSVMRLYIFDWEVKWLLAECGWEITTTRKKTYLCHVDSSGLPGNKLQTCVSSRCPYICINRT